MKKKKKDRIVTVDMYHQYAEIDEMYSSRPREVKLNIPSNLRMLCAILEVEVEKLLNDFIWMLSYSHHNSATSKQRKIAKKFFLCCKFGQPFYSKKQIMQMFNELKSQRKIDETVGTIDYKDRELFWKNKHMYIQYWFKRWFEMNRHNGDVSKLEEY